MTGYCLVQDLVKRLKVQSKVGLLTNIGYNGTGIFVSAFCPVNKVNYK